MTRRQRAEDWGALPSDLHAAVKAWLKANGRYVVEPRGWFTDGRSGEPVGLVRRDRRSDGDSEQLILKFLTKGAARRANDLRTAWSESGSFYTHLAEPLREGMVLDGDRQGVFLRVAGGDTSAFRPLTDLLKDNHFPQYCGQIVHSVVHDWNERRCPPKTATVGVVVETIMRRHRDDALKWARSVNIAVDSESAAFKDGTTFPVNPFTLLTGRAAKVDIPDLFVGKAHGDLSGRNILLEARPGVDPDPDSYVLIDYDRYDWNAPLARDPMHLLVALVLDHFGHFGQESWQDLAKALVFPDEGSHPAEVERFRRASSVIREESAPEQAKGWGEQWRQQCLLFLAGAALLHLGRELHVRDRDGAKQWCFRVAALAAEAVLKDRLPATKSMTDTMPSPTEPT